MSKRTWQEKLADNKDLPKVARIDAKMSQRWGQGTFVIPAPLEVDAVMRRVPKGKLTTIDELRTALAQKHGATIACPLTTGIFARLAARTAKKCKPFRAIAFLSRRQFAKRALRHSRQLTCSSKNSIERSNAILASFAL